MTTNTRLSPQFASTLPGYYYHDPAIYALEQERIFSQLWVCVGRAEEVAQAGDYQVTPVGPESVLIVRQRDGRLGAFLNVCRHRGARLCPEGSAGQLGNAIRCRYHAWTYGLDGQLLGVPNVAAASEAFDRSAHGLVPVTLAVWEGLIWLNLADQPQPIAEQLNASLLERFGNLSQFARYGVGTLKVGKTLTYDVHSNWKLVVENFMECYHCAPMHPELCRLLPDFRGGQSYQSQVGEGTLFAEDIATFSFSGQGQRPRLPGLLPEDDRLYYGLVLAPNVLVSLLPDHVILHTAFPQAPDRTSVRCDWLFDPQVVAAPDFDPTDAVEVFDLVNRQDWEVCELTQQGMTSKAYRAGGVYVPNESHLRNFSDFVLNRLARQF